MLSAHCGDSMRQALATSSSVKYRSTGHWYCESLQNSILFHSTDHALRLGCYRQGGLNAIWMQVMRDNGFGHQVIMSTLLKARCYCTQQGSIKQYCAWRGTCPRRLTITLLVLIDPSRMHNLQFSPVRNLDMVASMECQKLSVSVADGWYG